MSNFAGRILGALIVGALFAGVGALKGCDTRPRMSGALAAGGSIQGRLEQGDVTLEQTGEFADFYSLQGRRGQRVVVRMSSGEVDSYLFIRGPGEFQQDNDDTTDGENENDACLRITLERDGEYIVCATSYARGEAGAYSLWME